MKKLILVAGLLMFGFTAMAQNGLRAGVNLGLPIGDAGDITSFSIVLDLGYLWEVSEDFQAGVTTGYSHSFGADIDFGPLGTVEGDDIQFLPIAASGRFNLSEDFSLGADVGYAIGINDGNDGGFYYSPRIAYGVSQSVDIVGAYRGITRDGSSFDIISLGVEFGL